MTGDVLDLIGALIHFAVGCVFIQAAVSKILQPDRVRLAVMTLGVPRPSSIVNGLIMIEGILGVALCAGWWSEIAVPVAIVMLIGLSGISLLVRLRTGISNCGCGIPLAPHIPAEVRNLVLALLLFGSVIWPPDAGAFGMGSGYYRLAWTAFGVLLIVGASTVRRAPWPQMAAMMGGDRNVSP